MIGSRYGHFEIERLLGTGGMGEVYLAIDMNLERRVALKFLPRSLTSDRTAQGRLLDEARSCARLQHPNIAVIHSVEEDGGVYAICMEYVEGTNLREILANRRLDIKRIVEIALGTARGIAAAHDHGIIHRDIKPSNVVITGRGRVKVMDFGLALRPRRTVETTGPESYGTVAYMSPEQAQGQELTAASDIFSFGSLLYQMVTGKLPFKGENDLATLHAIISEDPQPLRELRRDIPPGLERLITSCLQKDPSRRPASIDEAVEVLQHLSRSVKHGPHDLISELTMGLETESLRRKHSAGIRPITKRVGDHGRTAANASKKTSKTPPPFAELSLPQTQETRRDTGRGTQPLSGESPRRDDPLEPPSAKAPALPSAKAPTTASAKTTTASAKTPPPLWKERLSGQTEALHRPREEPAAELEVAEALAISKPWWKTALIGLLALATAIAFTFALKYFVIQSPPSDVPAKPPVPAQIHRSAHSSQPPAKRIGKLGLHLENPVEPLPDMIDLQLPPAG